MKPTFLKLNAFALLFLLFVAGSCKKEKEDPQLPPVTQTGAGTFGCMVNGEVWVAKNRLFGSTIGASNNQWGDKRWIIEGVGDDYTIIIELCKDSVMKEESILIGPFEESCSSSMVYFKNYPVQTASFQTSYENVGKVFISRFDTINRIMSGTFYFDAVNSAGEKAQIRDGRFDVKIYN